MEFKHLLLSWLLAIQYFCSSLNFWTLLSSLSGLPGSPSSFSLCKMLIQSLSFPGLSIFQFQQGITFLQECCPFWRWAIMEEWWRSQCLVTSTLSHKSEMHCLGCRAVSILMMVWKVDMEQEMLHTRLDYDHKVASSRLGDLGDGIWGRTSASIIPFSSMNWSWFSGNQL